MFRYWLIAVILIGSPIAFAAPPVVRTFRVPENGIQPQVAVDSVGTAHLIFYKGEPAHGDLSYCRSTDSGSSFSKPIPVNSQAGSAIAIGTIRGAQMAIGKDNRVHVAWNGSDVAEPKGPGNAAPMLYARLNNAVDGFEPQRNIIAAHYGLDGGGSIAADADGHVHIAWHAPEKKGQNESGRRVWIARSIDSGKSFTPETAASIDSTGVCGCCGMKILADPRGGIFILYRSATEMVHRDMYLLHYDRDLLVCTSAKIAPMTIGQCVMSSAAMANSATGPLAAWETESQIYWGKLDPEHAKILEMIPAPGPTRGRKHPALATNAAGDVLLVWTEGTGWNKGGSIAWQIYDAAGAEVKGTSGKKAGLPVWSLPAAFANQDGGFTIVF